MFRSEVCGAHRRVGLHGRGGRAGAPQREAERAALAGLALIALAAGERDAERFCEGVLDFG